MDTLTEGFVKQDGICQNSCDNGFVAYQSLEVHNDPNVGRLFFQQQVAANLEIEKKILDYYENAIIGAKRSICLYSLYCRQ